LHICSRRYSADSFWRRAANQWEIKWGFYGAKYTDIHWKKHENKLKSKGILVVSAAHAFEGLSQYMCQGDVRDAPAIYIIGYIVASTLRFV
jgi:hypothetical protein